MEWLLLTLASPDKSKRFGAALTKNVEKSQEILVYLGDPCFNPLQFVVGNMFSTLAKISFPPKTVLFDHFCSFNFENGFYRCTSCLAVFTFLNTLLTCQHAKKAHIRTSTVYVHVRQQQFKNSFSAHVAFHTNIHSTSINVRAIIRFVLSKAATCFN